LPVDLFTTYFLFGSVSVSADETKQGKLSQSYKKKVKSNENRIRNGKQNKGKCVNRANDSIFSFWAKGVPATDD